MTQEDIFINVMLGKIYRIRVDMYRHITPKAKVRFEWSTLDELRKKVYTFGIKLLYPWFYCEKYVNGEWIQCYDV